MTDIHLLGIRHHGPGSCRNILQELERIRPDLILLEGPAEAEALMPFVSYGQMKPPVALLGYQPDVPQNAVFYPFADFSPEWQALRYALRENVTLRFFDLPLAHSLAFEAERKDGNEPVEADDEAIKQPGDPFDLLAEAAGIAALSAEDYRKMSLEFLQNERWRLFDELGKLGFRMWKPSANYVFFQAEQCPDLDRQLLPYGILLRHCDTYDGLDATYYRAAVRLPEENQYLLHCLRCILGEEGLLWQQNH